MRLAATARATVIASSTLRQPVDSGDPHFQQRVERPRAGVLRCTRLDQPQLRDGIHQHVQLRSGTVALRCNACAMSSRPTS